jgi:hypothetical protein
MRFLLALLLLATISYAQPQPQSPRANGVDRSAKKNKPQPLVHTDPPASPAETTEKAQTSKTADAGKQETHGPTNDQRLADYTGKLAEYTKALAAFTAVLVVVGILQFAALFWQARILGHHSRSLRQSVIQMRRSVRAYRRYVELGEDALKLTSESNETTRDATGLTRQSLMLTHRPKLIARVFYINAALGVSPTVEGKFTIANVGGTDARITEIFATAITDPNLDMKPVYEGQHGKVVDIVLKPGQPTEWKFRRDDGALTQDEVIALGRRSSPVTWAFTLFVIGFVKYTDALDPPTIRRTAFCRRLNQDTMRFEPVKDCDYEHAD